MPMVEVKRRATLQIDGWKFQPIGRRRRPRPLQNDPGLQKLVAFLSRRLS